MQEHIIHVWKEEGSEFHNDLIKLYLQEVEKEVSKSHDGIILRLSNNYIRIAAPCVNSIFFEEIEENAAIRSNRTLLVKFLKESNSYTPQSLVTFFPTSS